MAYLTSLQAEIYFMESAAEQIREIEEELLVLANSSEDNLMRTMLFVKLLNFYFKCCFHAYKLMPISTDKT